MRARILALVLFTAPAAFAQAPGPGESAFREGRALMQAGDAAGACSKFAESQRLEPAPGTLLNIGQCEEKQSHLVAARDAYEKAAAGYTQAERKSFAQSRAVAVDARIPRLYVKLASTAPKETVVRVGDAPLEIGKAVPMDPGEVALQVSAPGRAPQRVSVTLREGQTLEIAVEPGAAGAQATVVSDTTRKDGDRAGKGSDAGPVQVRTSGMSKKTLGLVIGGVGAASLVVGGVTGIMAMGKADTVKQHCDGNLACDSEGLDAASSGKTLALVSTITLAVGVVGVGVGTFLFVSGGSSKAAAASPSTALVPAAGPHGGSLSFVRSF